MPFTRTSSCDRDNTAVATPYTENSFNWQSFLSLGQGQGQDYISDLASARTQRSLPSSLPLTLFGENGRHLFQIPPATTEQVGVDRLISILDAALEIVEKSDIHLQDDESSVVIGQSPSQNHGNVGDSNSMNDRGQGRMGRKTIYIHQSQ
jgi:hypothetical protein